MLKNTLIKFLALPVPTAGRVTFWGTGLGVILATLGNPAVSYFLIEALFSPLLFVVVYGAIALLTGVELFFVRKFAAQKRLRFVAGPICIVALVTFVVVSLLVPNF